jgi:hypothetical protein
MKPSTQATLSGTVTGLVVFGALFFFWTKAKAADLEAIGANSAPAIAEQAVKDYIATKFGATPERLQAIMARVTQLQSLIALARPAS